ncbi:MAG: LysR substrate-binding domain-containing protein [Janthinobacterium lividum]
MELRHLNYFVSIASAGGFGKAARHLHVSQSAISEQMRDLEQEVGAALFDRTHRQIRLTTQGEVFLTGAKATLQAAERTVQAVQQSLRGDTGKLTIGFFVGGNGSFFPTVIREFRKQHVGVHVTLVEMIPTRQVEALLRGDIDIAFTRPLPAHLHEQLHYKHVYTEPLYAVLPKDHPATRLHQVEIQALQKEPFVMVERSGSPVIFDKVIALCNEAGFSPGIAATASVSSGVLALVEAGEGVSIIPEGSRFLASKEIAFVPIAGANASVDLVMAWSPERLNPPMRAFIASATKNRTRSPRPAGKPV